MTELKRKQPGIKGVEHAVERHVDKALEALAPWPLSDETIHAARKELKAARAALRLERAALDDGVFERENRTLRDAARPLREVRDSVVMLDTVDRLRLDGSAEGLREALAAERREVGERALPNRERLEPVIASLRLVRSRLADARLERHGWDALGRGVRRTYRAGRRAFAEACAHPTAENLHECRKQTKYLWRVLQMLHPVASGRLDKLERRAHRLSDQLGQDHDLFLLARSKAARTVVPLSLREAARERIERRRATLQKRAMALGAVVYKDRPRTLERRLGRRWRAWRSA